MSTDETAAPPAPLETPDLPPPVPPPSQRALRTMAVVRWLLLALVTLLAGYSVWTNWGPQGHGHAAPAEAEYYCPMHPQIRATEPGECPICHMTLELVPEERRGPPGPGASANTPQAPAHPPTVTTVKVSADKQRAIGLATSMVESSTVGDRLRVPGVVSAPETGLAQVRVRAPGFVEQVAIGQTGVRVSKGQALAFIYSPEIYRAQEEFITATRWVGAGSVDGAGDSHATEIVIAARRGLELLGLSAADVDEVAKTGRPIRAIPVRAPSAGFITRFNAVLGTRAEPDMVLYEIADLSRVWVIASVHERDLNALGVGMTAQFRTTSSDSEPLRGRIELIEPLLEESTRTARVRLVIANSDGRLRPGQFGDAEFELPPSAGLFVPQDAVIRTGEHEYVYVMTSDERFEPRLVRSGRARDGRIQLLSGVTEGEKIVTRGSFMLDSESRLQASLGAPPAPTTTPSSVAQAPSSVEGASCDAAFDRTQFPEKYGQCRACEVRHAGMGRMVADCKDAIVRPWR